MPKSQHSVYLASESCCYHISDDLFFPYYTAIVQCDYTTIGKCAAMSCK
jgi:hypothetical protein